MKSLAHVVQPIAGALIISLAFAISGPAAFAAGVGGISFADDSPASLLGTFSDSDLYELEHANAAEAKATRLAEFGGPAIVPARQRSAAREPSTGGETEVFPLTGSLLPLLVTKADSAAPRMVRTASTDRLGLVQPVGVTRSSLRSPTPAERGAR